MKMLESLSLAWSTIARVFETRLLLFGAEIEFERIRFVRYLWLCIAGVAAFCTGIITTLAFIVLSVSEEHRTTVLLFGAITLLGASAICIGLAWRSSDRIPFKASADCLKEDYKCLGSLTRK